jgi:hypothetical protein
MWRMQGRLSIHEAREQDIVVFAVRSPKHDVTTKGHCTPKRDHLDSLADNVARFSDASRPKVSVSDPFANSTNATGVQSGLDIDTAGGAGAKTRQVYAGQLYPRIRATLGGTPRSPSQLPGLLQAL